MENYRKKLKIDNIISIISVAALATVMILSALGIINPIAGDSHWHDFWNGCTFGMSFAIIGASIFGLIKNIIALKNEDKLKKQYIKANDERDIEIADKGKSLGASAFLLCLPAAIVISGYFSITVCLTLLAITFSLSIFMVTGKIIYSKKI